MGFYWELLGDGVEQASPYPTEEQGSWRAEALTHQPPGSVAGAAPQDPNPQHFLSALHAFRVTLPDGGRTHGQGTENPLASHLLPVPANLQLPERSPTPSSYLPQAPPVSNFTPKSLDPETDFLGANAALTSCVASSTKAS